MSWADVEMDGVDLGDSRLNDRAVKVLRALGNRPQLSIPAACGGHAEMTAAYRFFDHSKVTFEKVLQPHIQATLKRMSSQDVVLLVQDTTEVNLTRPHQQMAGAGELDGFRRGVLLHTMHGFTPAGTPLGTAWGTCLNRKQVSREAKPVRRRQRKQKPIEEKESMRWVEGLRQANQIAQDLPGVDCICIADSEADVYQCLCELPAKSADGQKTCDWLIRGCHDRLILDENHDPCGHLRQQVAAGKVLYHAKVQVRERESKIKSETRSRRQSRGKRTAKVQVRARRVRLNGPTGKNQTGKNQTGKNQKQTPLEVNVVLVSETDPPAGAVPLEWILLTSLAINTPQQVRQVVEYYCVRWNIEILFRTFKSGCRIEKRRFENIDRMLPAMALYLIAAWRTLLASRLSRESPQANCQILLEPSEWKAVWRVMKKTPLPQNPPPLQEMIQLIAVMGGYIKRPNSPPGPQTLWIGLQRMYDLTRAWQTFGPEAKNDAVNVV